MAYENNYEFFYKGGGSALKSDESDLSTGYSMNAGRIGSPTSIQTANQISEVTSRLNEGVKTVEMQPIQAEIFDAIPKQHFKEINRLSQLVGSDVSVHAPMIDPAGFTKEGWSDQDREQAEQQLLSVVERSHEVGPKGNVPITIHASAIPGTEFMKNLHMPEEVERKIREGYLPESAREEAQMFAVNRDTGQIIPVKLEKRFYPEEKEQRWNTPRENIEMINNSEWQEKLIRMEQYKKMSDELREQAIDKIRAIQTAAALTGGKLTQQEDTDARMAESKLKQSQQFLSDVGAVLRTSYSTAYKYSDPKEKQALGEAREKYVKLLNIASNQEVPYPERVQAHSQAVREMMDGLSQVRPNTYIPIEDFAKEKASTTLGNVAFEAYKKFKENTPILSVENLYPGMAFSRADQIKGLIESSRNQFVERAVKDGVMGRGEAEQQAKKLIGVTWDVGHLNQLRKGGYNEDDLIKETAAIAPYVKHVHLTDNFGFSDSHLPPGMGNVPLKGIMTELQNAGYKGKGIVEAGNFVQHFKTSPHTYTLEALGSPIYPALMQPTWGEVRGTYGAYFGGYGTMLPEQHFSMYGSGFSALPTELGGQIPGKQSRLSGAPMD
jgi:hypothetical protein